MPLVHFIFGTIVSFQTTEAHSDIKYYTSISFISSFLVSFLSTLLCVERCHNYQVIYTYY